MFTKKTVVVTSSGSKLSKSIDDLMEKGSEMLGKGMEMLDSSMRVLDEAFKDADMTEAVTTTIRIRLTPQQIAALEVNKTLTFKADGVTILLERGAA